MKVGILGTGAFGLALSSIIDYNAEEIIIWTKFDEEKKLVEKNKGNQKLLPNYFLSNKIKVTTDIYECVKDKDLVVVAIPANCVYDTSLELKKYISKSTVICITSKGIDKSRNKFISEIIEKILKTSRIAILSGPTFALDVIKKDPIGFVVATKNQMSKEIVAKAFSTKYTKIEYTNDIIGTELCGSIKNVFAISLGILDGLGSNDSTRAMFLAEELNCLKMIIKKLGGNGNTVLTLAGIGDLLLTCTSTKSRNHNFGKLLGKGASKKEITNYLKNYTVEGYHNLEAIHNILKRKNIKVPLIEVLYSIVIEGKNPRKLLYGIINR